MKKLTLTISQKKGVMGGAWCIDGTRIPLAVVYHTLKVGGTKLLFEAYPQLKETKKQKETKQFTKAIEALRKTSKKGTTWQEALRRNND